MADIANITKFTVDDLVGYLNAMSDAIRALDEESDRLWNLSKSTSVSWQEKTDASADYVPVDSALNTLIGQKTAVLDLLMRPVEPPTKEIIALTRESIDVLAGVVVKRERPKAVLKFATDALEAATQFVTKEVPAAPAPAAPVAAAAAQK